jgi:tetratricopeptide (TPR) repeat protein
VCAGAAIAQSPAPGGGASPGAAWTERGNVLLEREDPVGAWQAFRRAIDNGAGPVAPQIGLGRVHLMLGRSAFAQAYADAALAIEPADPDGMSLCVRALIRARAFDEAVARAAAFLHVSTQPDAELVAAGASALFRVQRIDDAAAAYRNALDLEPLHAEGHLRLGSGLLPPIVVSRSSDLRAAVDAIAADRLALAVELLQRVLEREPGHPIAHRLLGETLFAQRAALSMANEDPAFAALAAALPHPEVRGVPIALFVPAYRELSPARRRVVDRVAALFAERIGRLVAIGGSHDLLRELDRTTDDPTRASLRGRRTFDGRVWDDVRGVGGLQAATGIEALDEAARFGFDTLAHEVAHQVHLHTMTPVQRARIRSLYKNAIAEGRCLDYYAASNEAEYFGQGVEAFVSMGKRPGGETTHGHTRFELYEVDRALHDFIASVVDWDPLRLPEVRERVLEAAVATALRCGRPEEAVTAAAMMSPGELRERLLAAAVRGVCAASCR